MIGMIAEENGHLGNVQVCAHIPGKIPPGSKLDVTCEDDLVQGQYVFITITKGTNNTLSLCGLEAYTSPITG